MTMSTIKEKSYLALVEFLMLSKHQIIEHGGTYGLTVMQSMTMFLLAESRPMNSLKNIFNCDASNITGLIDGLEQKQLVERAEHPSDRRLKIVQLTDKGNEIRAQLLNDVTSAPDYWANRLSPAETATFIELVRKITAA